MTRAEQLIERCLELAPKSKALHARAGMMYLSHLQSAVHKDRIYEQSLAERARKHLKSALSLNDALPKESLRRFTTPQIKRIHQAFFDLEKR
jgi:hypothetical protein